MKNFAHMSIRFIMNKAVCCLLLITGFLPQVYLLNKWLDVHPDAYLSITQLVIKYGYPIESHYVTTEDGYTIEIFRIPHGKHASSRNEKPLLLFHGLLEQADHFVLAGSYNSSMAFFFADRGYDVWLGNTRGNGYGLKHDYLSSEEREFWNFSLHEIAIFDLSSIIDFILEITKKKRLFYVGFSQGGTIFFILNSLKPEYQEKIVAATLLAPAGYQKHFWYPMLSSLAQYHEFLTRLFNDMDFFRFPPSGLTLEMIFSAICNLDMFEMLCDSIANEVVGYSGETNPTFLRVILHSVAPISTKQALHFAQMIKSGHFRQWDYGEARNLKVYGALEPPDYLLDRIAIPVYIFYSISDGLVHYADVQLACETLRNCTAFMMAPPGWSHLDFIFSKNLNKLINRPILKIFNSYNISTLSV